MTMRMGLKTYVLFACGWTVPLVVTAVCTLFKQLMCYIVSCLTTVGNENLTSLCSADSKVNKTVCGYLALYETASLYSLYRN